MIVSGGHHNYCRSTQLDQMPFCIKPSGEKQNCIAIPKCKPLRIPTSQVSDELDDIKYKMKSDISYRLKMTQLAANFSSPAMFFEPPAFTCDSITLYQAFVAEVVNNVRVIDMMNDCDSIQFSPSIPILLKWLLHVWNLICFAIVYCVTCRLIIRPIDEHLSQSLSGKKAKPNSAYKMNGYLTS